MVEIGGMQAEAAGPIWQMSLRVRPEVQLIARAIDGLTADRLTVTWRSSQWLLVLAEYEAEFVIDEHVVSVQPGTIVITPPVSECIARFNGRSEQIHVLFQLAGGRGDEIPVPCLTRLGTEHQRIRAQLAEALGAFPTQPASAARAVHDVLYGLARSQPVPLCTSMHPAVSAAVAFIEYHLDEPISVKTVAQHAKLSERQLSTHFRRQFDTTVIGYIRRRRAERARKLLQVTDLPMKSIAAQVGIGDLQRFNKLIRHELGASPRKVRASPTQED